MHECLLCVVTIFPAIDSNDECVEEGEVFEYQEEGDQAQAVTTHFCKPGKLVVTLSCVKIGSDKNFYCWNAHFICVLTCYLLSTCVFCDGLVRLGRTLALVT
jgi:hypothetical protein